MSEATVADDLLRSYFERWQRLEEDKAAISEDLKALFAEAKGNGFDTKVMRAVFREEVSDKAERDEFEAICDLYRASLARPRAHPAPARVETLNNSPLPAPLSSPGARMAKAPSRALPRDGAPLHEAMA